MNIFKVLLLTLLISCISCDKIYKDCLCTEEFRMYSLTILDNNNTPIDSVNITVTNKLSNQVYDLSDYDYDFLPKGEYIIFHDGFKRDLSTVIEVIVVESEIDSTTVQTELGFNTDECNCHVQKAFGPDSIWVDLNN